LSAVEVAISVGSAAVGAAAGSLAVYFGSKKPNTSHSDSKESTENETPISSHRVPESSSIPKGQLEKSKRELRTLLLEKELVSAALTRLYEAEAAKEITKDEREILGAKYKTELKSLDDRISKIDAFIQIGDLETLRNQLLQLVNQKMEAIERRIESTKSIAEPIIAEMMNKPEVKPVSKLGDERARIPDISDMLEKPGSVQPLTGQAAPEQQPMLSIRSTGTPIATPDQGLGKKSGDKVEELQKELLEALDRLEKLDVES
jgi:hypothetical protein